LTGALFPASGVSKPRSLLRSGIQSRPDLAEWLRSGKVRMTKRYTAEMIDWLAVYDRATDCCYYIPAEELAAGMSMMHLRLRPALNGQRLRIRHAADYAGI
jgi:PD-(D/E)XK endonuclease